MPSLFLKRRNNPSPSTHTQKRPITPNTRPQTSPNPQNAPLSNAMPQKPLTGSFSGSPATKKTYYSATSPNLSVKSFPDGPMTTRRLTQELQQQQMQQQRRVLTPNETRLIHDNLVLAEQLEGCKGSMQELQDANAFLVHKCAVLEDERATLQQKVRDLERAIQEYRFMRANRVRLGTGEDVREMHDAIVESSTSGGVSPSYSFTMSRDAFIDTKDLVKDLDGAFSVASSSRTSLSPRQSYRRKSVPSSPQRSEEPSVQEIAADPQILPSNAASPLDIASPNSKIFTYVAEKSNEIQWNTENGFPDLRAYQRAIAQLITKYELNEPIPEKQIADLNLLRRNHLQHMIFEQYRMWFETDAMEGKYPTAYRRPVIWYPYWRSGRSAMGWISEGTDEKIHVKTEYFALPENYHNVLAACCKHYYQEAQKRYDRGDRQFIEDSVPALFMNCTLDYTLESNQRHVDNHKHVAYVYVAHTKVSQVHKEHEIKVKNILAHFYNTARMNTFVPFEGAQVIHLILALNWLKDPKTFAERSKIFAIHKFPNAKYQTVADMKKKEAEFVTNMGLRLPFFGANKKV